MHNGTNSHFGDRVGAMKVVNRGRLIAIVESVWFAAKLHFYIKILPMILFCWKMLWQRSTAHHRLSGGSLTGGSSRIHG